MENKNRIIEERESEFTGKHLRKFEADALRRERLIKVRRKQEFYESKVLEAARAIAADKAQAYTSPFDDSYYEGSPVYKGFSVRVCFLIKGKKEEHPEAEKMLDRLEDILKENKSIVERDFFYFGDVFSRIRVRILRSYPPVDISDKTVS